MLNTAIEYFNDINKKFDRLFNDIITLLLYYYIKIFKILIFHAKFDQFSIILLKKITTSIIFKSLD